MKRLIFLMIAGILLVSVIPAFAAAENPTQLEEPPTQICGFKYADWEGDMIPLPGWVITLEKWVEGDPGDWQYVDNVTTDASGAYCFTDLEEGTYKVSETLKDGWKQVSPEAGYHEVTLPNGDSQDASYDFVNTPELYCFDETAWAAQEEPGQFRFVAKGNWATFIEYTVDNATAEDPAVFPLYAGQYNLAGELHVYVGSADNVTTLYVKYVAAEQDDEYQEGLCGGWGLLEYHLHVAADIDGFKDVRTSDRHGNAANPMPGQFEYSMEYEEKQADTGWIAVDIDGFGDEIVIAAQAAMEWCGYNCDALAEIEAAQPNGD